MRIAILSFCFLVACAHARSVDKPAAGTAPGNQNEKVVQKPNQAPVAQTPAALFEHGGVTQIQKALSKNGLEVKENGLYDEKTQLAMKKFQAQKNLPQTGMPDQRTLRELKVDPDQVYRSNPKATKDAK